MAIMKLSDNAFRSDMLVESQVINKLKSLEKIASLHTKPVLRYLKPSGLKIGLLINFGEVLLNTDIARLLNGELK